MSRRRQLGIAGLVAGTVAAGVAGAVAAERRAIGRDRNRSDPVDADRLGSLHSKGRTVTADDGVPLHVELAGDKNAPLTVIFVHGFALSMDCYHYQRRDLPAEVRCVFYDQRSHGASGRGPSEHSTIDQLGRDLHTVLRVTAPKGPVVLVGHSMGGMTVMALADQHPELFGDRVVGVVLMSTAPGAFAETIFGIPGLVGRALRPVAPGVLRRVNRQAALVERGRGAAGDLSWVLTRRWAYGADPSPALVEFAEKMIANTSVEVMTEFIPTFLDHDKLEALGVLRGVPTLILVGSKDQLTPVRHSRQIADAVPDAELVVVDGAGHLVLLERPEEVNAALRDLFARALRRDDAAASA